MLWELKVIEGPENSEGKSADANILLRPISFSIKIIYSWFFIRSNMTWVSDFFGKGNGERRGGAAVEVENKEDLCLSMFMFPLW